MKNTKTFWHYATYFVTGERYGFWKFQNMGVNGKEHKNFLTSINPSVTCQRIL